MNPFFQDGLDDPLLAAGTVSFSGWNPTLKPSLLDDMHLVEAQNVIMDVDGLCVQRPGLDYLALVEVQGGNSSPVQGIIYFDTRGRERIIVARGGQFFEMEEVDEDSRANLIHGVNTQLMSQVNFAQLNETLYFADSAWGLGWMRWTGGAFTYGRVKVAKNITNTGAQQTLPDFSDVIAHRFRLFAYAEKSDEIWVGAYLNGASPGDWDLLNSFRVGDGDGDFIVSLCSFQDNKLVVLKQSSIYSVDTSAEKSADFTIQKLTGLAGCSARRTVVQLGQDVLFLSRLGVMSLGALIQTNSISSSTAISGAIRSIIERINWKYAHNAWAVSWRQYYLLALPIDSEQGASKIVVYNTQTKEWVGQWDSPLPDIFKKETDAPIISYGTRASQIEFTDMSVVVFAGWTCGTVTRFDGKIETVICDNVGRIFKLDEFLEEDYYSSEEFSKMDITASLKTKMWDMQLPDAQKQLFRLELEAHRQSTPKLSVSIQRDGYESQHVGEYSFNENLSQFPITFPLQFSRASIQKRSLHLRSANFGRWRELSIILTTKGKGRLSMRGIRFDAFADTGRVIF
jgi:hypothetical protein